MSALPVQAPLSPALYSLLGLTPYRSAQNPVLSEVILPVYVIGSDAASGGGSSSGGSSVDPGYAGGFVSNVPAAGQVAETQLFNPASSGKNVLLDSVIVAPGASGFMQMYRNTAALASNINRLAKLTGPAASDGVAQVRTTIGGVSGTGTEVMEWQQAVNDLKTLTFRPIIITPGNGVSFVGPAAALIACSFFWREQATG